MKVTCDQCARRFIPALQEIPEADGGVVQQFACPRPRCAHIYPVCRITAAGVELRRRIQSAIAAGDEQLRARLVTQLQAEITRLSQGDGAGG